MKSSGTLVRLLFAVCLLAPTARPQSQQQTARPVVVSAQMQRGVLMYKVDGRRVEDSRKNSLLTALGEIVKSRGADAPVIIIIDERAPFTEVGKLETALDKVDLTRSRKLFVSDFRDGTMNEIHWDTTPIPIPSS